MQQPGLIALCLYAAGAIAQQETATGPANVVDQGAAIKPVREGFTSDNPNFFGLAFPGGGDDEKKAQFYISIKYPLTDFGTRRLRLYMTYSGLYDFYLFESDVYESSPVVSRVQNPGFFFEWRVNPLDAPLQPFTGRKWRFGWMHESNGQSIEAQDEYDFVLAGFTARALKNDNHDPALPANATQGQVSRGWDYLNLRFDDTNSLPYEQGYFHYQVELRYFLHKQGYLTADREDRIFWDEDVDAEIEQFDGLRAAVEYGPTDTLLLRGDLKTGYAKFGNWSYRLALDWKPMSRQDLVLSFSWFNGYGREPSTYQRRNSYIGVGIELRSGLPGH